MHNDACVLFYKASTCSGTITMFQQGVLCKGSYEELIRLEGLGVAVEQGDVAAVGT